MRTFKTIVLFAAAMMAFAACGEGPADQDKTPELVGATISNAATPIYVDLDETTALDLIWAAGSWDGEGMITYTVVVDKTTGDFSAPVKVLNPAPGTLSVSMTKNELTALFAECAATEDATEASAKWAVKSAAGGKTVTSEPQTINMTKSAAPVGPQPVAFAAGASIFAAGAGAMEAGQEMTYIAEHPFNTNGPGYQDGQAGGVTPDYEFFTKIEADKDFYLTYGEAANQVDGYITFADGATLNAATTFATSNEAPAAGFKVTTTSVYRIRLNVSEGKAIVQIVNAAVIRCFGREKNTNGNWAQTFTTDLPMEYKGNGVWTAADTPIKWGKDSFDERFDTYKFALDMNEAHNFQLYGVMDGTALPDDVNPTKETPVKYWAVQPVQGGAIKTKGSIRLPMWLISADKNPAYTADINLYLNFSKGDYYFHDYTNEKAVTE